MCGDRSRSGLPSRSSHSASHPAGLVVPRTGLHAGFNGQHQNRGEGDTMLGDVDTLIITLRTVNASMSLLRLFQTCLLRDQRKSQHDAPLKAEPALSPLSSPARSPTMLISESSPATLSPNLNLQASGLLSLPPELRNAIYELALNESIGVVVDNRFGQPALLNTCRQIRAEARPVWYTENRFLVRIHNSKDDVLARFDEHLVTNCIEFPVQIALYHSGMEFLHVNSRQAGILRKR